MSSSARSSKKKFYGVDTMMGCDFCGRRPAKYCDICDHWLCEDHRRNLPFRVKEAIAEFLKRAL